MQKNVDVEVEARNAEIPKEAEQKLRAKKCWRMSDGVYVKGLVENVPVVFTVISSRVFKRIGEDQRPELMESTCLKGAGGTPIQECGKAKFKMHLGPLELISEAEVAVIEDDPLLRYNVLKGHDKGAADILISKIKIVLDGKDIPCFQVGHRKI